MKETDLMVRAGLTRAPELVSPSPRLTDRGPRPAQGNNNKIKNKIDFKHLQALMVRKVNPKLPPLIHNMEVKPNRLKLQIKLYRV